MRGEFDFIENIRKTYGLAAVGDDCAVLPQNGDSDLLVTADLLIEDIDFRLDWTGPEELGHKALAVSLSDIAAMGGEPKWSLTSIGVPEKLWDSAFIDRFYHGWHKLAQRCGVVLVGGDVSRTPDKFLIDSVVGGNASRGKAILRRGAKPGDAIFVTGELGGAAGGLRLLKSGFRTGKSDNWQEELIERQLRPEPRVSEGLYLLTNGIASSMIDISDGLSSDLYHICEASGVGAELSSSSLPIDENLKRLTSSSKELLDLALNGGEDFELLFTVSEEKISSIESGRFFRVGTVTASDGIIELTTSDGKTILKAAGYRHF